MALPDYGDFVEDLDERDDIENISESIFGYQNAVYYPICIGEVLAGTYRIEHKLGHGGYSTVWMAHDIQKSKDVALKIMIGGTAGEYEYSMQNEIIRTVPDTSRLLTYLDTFSLPGRYDSHRVLVFPVRGPSLATTRMFVEQIPMATRMSAALQLLTALESLHNAGYVHRDLNGGSVMWGIVPLDQYDTNTKYKYLGRPQKIALPNPAVWKQGEIVKPVEVPMNMLRDEIYLGDFGLTMRAGTSTDQKLQTVVDYCAPERSHNIGPSYASDMWSYMCLFAELYLGRNPVRARGLLPHISSLVATLGPLPEHWRGYYNGADISEDWWYDGNGMANPEYCLEAEFELKRPEIGPTERDLVLSVMSKVFRYLPEDRLSATQLLQDASFKTLMELYRRS